MQKVIRNNWQRQPGKSFIKAGILRHEVHPEGLDIERIRFLESGRLTFEPGVGHIISILRGNGRLCFSSNGKTPYRLGPGVHVYLPPGIDCFFEFEAEAQLLSVSAGSASQTRGRQLLVRDEIFLAACASGSQMLRWILTPQYLSRRIFLHHDQTLLSKSGNPVSWFRTTMFDVAGLPVNDDGQPVFKMSYNSRTELNVCYDVDGDARVRMALHPYRKENQPWEKWHSLDSECSYHLNEANGGPEEETIINDLSASSQFLRNKHEVYIADGQVTLFCLFDPAPTGIECHHPGEYSDYGPLSEVIGTKEYETYRRELAKYDQVMDTFSQAHAAGDPAALHVSPLWELYLKGRRDQATIETELHKRLIAEGNGRERILERWMQKTVDYERESYGKQQRKLIAPHFPGVSVRDGLQHTTTTVR